MEPPEPDPPAESDRGALLAHFEQPVPDLRAQGRMRQVTGMLAAAASLAVLLGRVPLAVSLVALTGLAVSLAWWRLGTRDVRRATDQPPDALRLYERGLWHREAGRAQWVLWRKVTAVTIDEERLTVCLKRTEAENVTLTPRYPDLPIDEMATLIARTADVPGPYDGSQSGQDDLQ